MVSRLDIVSKHHRDSENPISQDCGVLSAVVDQVDVGMIIGMVIETRSERKG
jgi:hypothetical protein